MLQSLWASKAGFIRTLKYVAPLVAAAILGVAFWESGALERERKAAQEEQRLIGFDASVTGGMLASAYMKCARIGITNVPECANWKGPLIDDVEAARTADLAVKQRMTFDTRCHKHYAPQDCRDLLSRAFQLAQIRPAE